MSSRKRQKHSRQFYRRVQRGREHDLSLLNVENNPAVSVGESSQQALAQESTTSASSTPSTPQGSPEPLSDDSHHSTASPQEVPEERQIPQLHHAVDLDLELDPEPWTLESFKKDLANWASSENIALSKLSSLLKILKKHEDFKDLPVDARTILKTPRNIEIEEMCGGNFVYLGLSENLREILRRESTLPEKIDLLVGIDGLPIAKSSTSQLWPQLGKIRSLPHSPVFVIGIYHGDSKPNNANEFLNYLVEELQLCIENGVEVNGETVKVTHVAFVCDVPAKSFILQIKGHAGYSSCTRCMDPGRYIQRRMCFSSESGLRRSHDDFRDQVDEEYHLGESIIVDIPGFDVVRDIPLDYMHLVCLGVVKKVLTLWLRGSLTCRLSSDEVSKLSRTLKSFRLFIPSEFSRKPRGLDELARWKATELRFFLLYAGPVVLAKHTKVMKADIIDNFMCLSAAMNLLVNPETCSEYKDYAQNLLEVFVVNFKKLYGQHLVSHNVHGLLHITDDVTTFGALDESSAFQFENYMQTLKSLMRKHHLPLQQICKRLKEKSQSMLTTKPNPKPLLVYSHESGPLIEQCTNPQYKTLQTPKFKISCNDKDGFCMTSNQEIIRVHNFAFSPQKNSDVVIGEVYEKVRDLFKNPFRSSNINTYLIQRKNNPLKVWLVEEIERKMVVLPFRRNLLAAMPVIHT